MESRYNIWVEHDGAHYVFNGVSGQLFCLTKDDYEAFQAYLNGEEETGCSLELLQQLALGRMIVPDGADELAFLARRYERSRGDTSHFGLTIVTSLGCNFDCPYCFEAKHPSIMDEQVQQAVLHVLEDQLPRIVSFRVTWFGGEPLVGKKPLLALSDLFIDRCNRSGVAYSADIVTNGYLLDEETCSDLRERHVKSAQVSIDGPPEVHDRMRPLAGGKGSFGRIIANLDHAVNYMNITVRVDVDKDNISHAEKLFQILAAQGLSGKLTVYPGQIIGVNDGISTPSATYRGCCFTNLEFARAEQEFLKLASRYGFARASLPSPTGAPCTAMRTNELVVGSKGELYKCWNSVGNRLEVIGDIREYENPNGRLHKWLKYTPFANAECRDCIALPVCMGGCAHHAMNPIQYENRCGTFRHMHHERVLEFVRTAKAQGSTGLVASASFASRVETR